MSVKYEEVTIEAGLYGLIAPKVFFRIIKEGKGWEVDYKSRGGLMGLPWAHINRDPLKTKKAAIALAKRYYNKHYVRG